MRLRRQIRRVLIRSCRIPTSFWRSIWFPDGVSDKDAPTASAKAGRNPPAVAGHTLQK
jgi:hypothetical protein